MTRAKAATLASDVRRSRCVFALAFCLTTATRLTKAHAPSKTKSLSGNRDNMSIWLMETFFGRRRTDGTNQTLDGERRVLGASRAASPSRAFARQGRQAAHARPEGV